MTKAEERVAEKLFALAPDPREGDTLFTVRFDPSTLTLYSAKSRRGRYYRLKRATVVEYRETPGETTPSGGVFTRRGLWVVTNDGRHWYGQLKKGTDLVKLLLVAPPVD